MTRQLQMLKAPAREVLQNTPRWMVQTLIPSFPQPEPGKLSRRRNFDHICNIYAESI
jgi:hypothetical protein